LAEYYGKSPDRISEEEVRQYFLHLKNDKPVAPGTFGAARAGIKFLFVHTLGREWRTLDLVRPPRESCLWCSALPKCARSWQVRSPRFRVCLNTIYACGLRVSEGVNLQVRAIDSERMVVQVRHGKGKRSLRPPSPLHPGDVERVLVHTPASPVAFSLSDEGRSPTRHGRKAHVCRRSSVLFQSCAGGKWHPQRSQCTYATPLLRHALAGSRDRSTGDPILPGTQFAANNSPLSPLDPCHRGTGSEIHRSTHGRSDMVEIADIFRRYGPEYRAKYGDKILPSHRQAMGAIERCRTAALGGHVYTCESCGETQYQYHSCRNRHCWAGLAASPKQLFTSGESALQNCPRQVPRCLAPDSFFRPRSSLCLAAGLGRPLPASG
jgi:hypothetical protein